MGYLEELERELATGEESLRPILLILRRAIGELREWIKRAVARLNIIEQSAVALTVVATTADLPASAPARQWFRVRGDPAVYIGNGPSQPLRKLVTEPL